MSTHLESYLNFYCSLQKPGYAVLVTGAWGVGKTYQVKKYFERGGCYYISLFGVDSVEQLNSEVIALCNPKLSKFMSGANAVADGVGDIGGFYALSSLSSTLLNSVLKQDFTTDKTLVFDDLERCSIEVEDLLGAINQFVEHHGFNVLVIAHDEKICDSVKERKEKVFGQTIRVDSIPEEAAESFFEVIEDSGLLAFMQEHKTLILDIFQRSHAYSLRVLRHVIEDVSRLYSCLEEYHRKHVEAMRDLIGFHVAMNIEIRLGRINPEDLIERSFSVYRYSYRSQAEDGEIVVKTPLVLFNERYAVIQAQNDILSDDVLQSMLCNGQYLSESIQSDLSRTKYFSDDLDIPPWKKIIQFDLNEDVTVCQGIAELDEQLESREIINSGEMLHAIALQLMMIENEIKVGKYEDVVKYFEEYIDELIELNLLPAREKEENWQDSFIRSHEGYTYWVTDATSQYFNVLKEYLVSSREAVLKESCHDDAMILIAYMADDVDEFARLVAPGRDNRGEYQLVPVFANLSPEKFVDSWLSCPVKNWWKISFALIDRYSSGRLEFYLQDERSWLEEVCCVLSNKHKEVSGIGALRLKRLYSSFKSSLPLAQTS